jgi:hypothetical protein
MNRVYGFYEIIHMSKYWTMRARSSDNTNAMPVIMAMRSSNNVGPTEAINLVVYEADKRNMTKYIRSACLLESHPPKPTDPLFPTIIIIRNDFYRALQMFGCKDDMLVGTITTTEGQVLDWRTLNLKRLLPKSIYGQTKLQRLFIREHLNHRILIYEANLGFLIRSDALEFVEAQLGPIVVPVKLCVRLDEKLTGLTGADGVSRA